jgi:hypothetical protein
MKGGHFGVMRFISIFDKADDAQRELVREMSAELVDAGIELGFIPYKTPPWVVAQHVEQRIDPGFHHLMRTLRSAVDPRGIMAPHCWPLTSQGDRDQ